MCTYYHLLFLGLCGRSSGVLTVTNLFAIVPPTPPIYSVQHDRSIRYVASENIEPLGPNDFVPDDFPIEIGKWFKRWDDDAKVFVSNIRDEYPDD